MARVTFDFDSDGYINVRGEKYSALEIVNDAGQTALDWMLEQDNEELIGIAKTWGLTPENDDKTGGKTDDGVIDDPENEGDVDDAVDKTDTGGGLSNEEVTSIQERLNNLFGYKMKNNIVQKDSKGNPIIVNNKAAIKITGGVEPKIQADGTVDIPGDVTINLVSDSKSMKSVDAGKFTVKFGRIDGNFICRGVKLSSLEGGPKFVKGTFDCGKNDLTSLTGTPDEVGIFIADQNPKLTSLAGGPKKINGMADPTKDQRTDIYRVDSCGLTSLDGNGITLFGPGGFNCANNKITSLTGLSTISSVGVTKFNCSKNNLSSLNGIPKPRKDAKSGKPGDFDISHNIPITTFPQQIADFEVNDFKANGLSLTSLSFAPKQVFGNFECTDNKSSTKITNQSIGKDRFKPTGFEEVAGNRIVKIDGDFVTNEGSWKDKTYDSNTVFKASAAVITGGPTKKGNDKYDQFNYATKGDDGKDYTDWWGNDTPLPPSKYTVIKASPSRTSLDVAIKGFSAGKADPKSTNCDTYFNQDTWGGAHKTFCNLGFWHGESRCPNKTTAYMAINGVYRGTSDSETYYPVLLVTTSGQAAIKKTSEARAIQSSIKWACGGSNKLIVGGAATAFGNTHTYATSIRNANRPRTAAGITKDGQIIAVITQTSVKWNNWKATLKAAGGWDMLNYDGGGSSFATVDGRKTQSSSRPVTTVLVFN